jgi:HlyD family secretion protein
VDEKLRPIETPLPQRIADFRRRYVPMMVWSIAALACVWMLAGRAARFEYIGMARSMQYEISASTTGQIDVLLVDLYDSVEAGDVVAKLDDTELAARVDRSRAMIGQLGAELNATRLQFVSANKMDEASWTNDLRRFQTDEEDRRLAALELRALIASDEIEVERLALELQRAGPLLETGLIDQAEHDSIRLLHGEARARIDENRVLHSQTQSEQRTATLRREAFEQGLPAMPRTEPLLEPLRAAIEVENQRLLEIQSRHAATVLRSPVTGQVSSILARRGQTVVPGELILTVTDGNVTEILAYLDEADGHHAQENTPVLVATMSRPDRVAESFVVRVAPDIELLPERMWRAPAQPEYGRAVVIAAVPSLDLTPGELLNVRLAGN